MGGVAAPSYREFLVKYSLILPLPFGVISDAHYTGLNINTAVWRGVNFEFARGIQEMKSDELKQDSNARFWF
ncbi:hypothetical protein GVv1_04940 [Enterobacter pseudoroggenkampii]